MTYMRDIPESHVALNNLQVATLLQQSFPRNVGTSNTTSQPSLPISVMPVSVMPASMTPFEDAYPFGTSSAHEQTGSKQKSIAIEACPFPKCRKTCGRPQENERHIRERHLPHHIYCGQLGCNWTGNRRDMLQKHLERKHSGFPMPEAEAFTIYDAKGLVKQLLNKEINVEEAVNKAQLLLKNWVLQNSLHCSQSAM